MQGRIARSGENGKRSPKKERTSEKPTQRTTAEKVPLRKRSGKQKKEGARLKRTVNEAKKTRETLKDGAKKITPHS